MDRGRQLKRLFRIRRDRAITETESALSQAYSCSRIAESDLGSIHKTLVAGWSLDIPDLAEVGGMIVGVDSRFPSVLPKIFLPPDTAWFGRLPHVNPNNSVCVAPSHANIDQARPGPATIEIVKSAIGTVLAGINRENLSDFHDEVESYWAEGCTSPEIVTICEIPQNNCRLHGALVQNGKWLVVGKDIDSLREWLSRLAGTESHCSFLNVVSLFFRGPFYPSAYPASSIQMCRMAADAGFGTMEEIAAQTSSSKKPLYILLSFPTRNGQAVVGTSISFKREVPGFRTGRIPGGFLLKLAAKESCARHKVFRADSKWLHWRGGASTEIPELPTKRVLIAGCGALGADISMLLAKAGVQKFTLVDNEVLTWDNIGRHLLGATLVGQLKVEALARRLGQHFPHLQIDKFTNRLEDLCVADSSILRDADIIVSATADWAAESALNLWAAVTGDKPVVFAWLEPHALAGHAILSSRSGGGCLGCGRNEFGEVRDRVTDWSAEVMNHVPACGGWFTPYGAIDADPIKDVAAQLVLNWFSGAPSTSQVCSYIGDPLRISQLGGIVRDQWQPILRSGVISQTIKRPLLKNPACPICQVLSKR